MSNKKRLLIVITVAMLVVTALAIPTSANSGAELATFVESIKGGLSDFTTTNLAAILVAALGLTSSLAIAWFAYRFIRSKVSSAMRRGKL